MTLKILKVIGKMSKKLDIGYPNRFGCTFRYDKLSSKSFYKKMRFCSNRAKITLFDYQKCPITDKLIKRKCYTSDNGWIPPFTEASIGRWGN